MAVMGEEVQFKEYEQHQGQLFPAHLRDALDSGDPVFFISDLVEGLGLEIFERRYAAMGEHAYPPRMLLKLWLFGAVAGVYSGREIAQRVRWDLRFRYLAGGLAPDFRTINRFRVRHREDSREVFARPCGPAGVRRAREAGTGGDRRDEDPGEHVSCHKAMSHARMKEAEQRLEDEIAQILLQMDQRNAAEDEEHGDDDGSGGLPVELQDREQRVAKLRCGVVRKQLEAAKSDRR